MGRSKGENSKVVYDGSIKFEFCDAGVTSDGSVADRNLYDDDFSIQFLLFLAKGEMYAIFDMICPPFALVHFRFNCIVKPCILSKEK